MSCCKSRRNFLKNSLIGGAAVAAWGMFPGFSSKAFAAGNNRRALIINMNGGMDWLYGLQPIAGAAYDTLRGMRPTLSRDPSGLLSVGGNFGFHPNLGILKSLYDEGSLLSIMKVGCKNSSRSHKDAEYVIARGVPDRLTSTASGFINRLGAVNGWDSMTAVSVSGTDPSFEGGEYRGIQANSLSSYYFRGDSSQSNQENSYRRDQIYGVSQYVDVSDSKRSDVVQGIGLAMNTSDSVKSAVSSTSFSNSYGNKIYDKQLKDAEILFANFGTKIAYTRRVGFDSHSAQTSNLDPIFNEFNSAFTVFVNNMKARGLWNDLIVMIVSEFGRTNRENGSYGTDHGGANTVLLTGGAVKGGIIGAINPGDLTDYGWLPMEINLVSVYRNVIEAMGLDPNAVFDPNPGGASLPSLFY